MAKKKEDKAFESLPNELKRTIGQWAFYTIKWLKESMVKSKMKQGALYRSFTKQIYYGADGMPTRVTIGFLFHGKFVDMGVGRGVKLENVKTNMSEWRALTRGERAEQRKAGYKPRRPKKWYSPIIYREYQRAAEILAGKYGIEVPARFESILSDDVEIKL